MSLKNRFIYKAAIGFSLGVLVTIVINIIVSSLYTGDTGAYINEFSGSNGGRTITALLLELLTGGLLGLVGNGGSVVYEIENWGILKPTTIHFVTTMIVYFAVGLFNGWLSPEINMVNIIQVVCMVIAYVLIWLTQYLIFKKEIREINEGIKTMKDKEANA